MVAVGRPRSERLPPGGHVVKHGPGAEMCVRASASVSATCWRAVWLGRSHDTARMGQLCGARREERPSRRRPSSEGRCNFASQSAASRRTW